MINLFYAYQPLLDFFLLNAGFALSQYIVLRAGVFSIATVGIVSVGAYFAAIVMKNYGLSIWLVAPAAAVVGLAIGLLLSIPLARLRGPYQAIASQASAPSKSGCSALLTIVNGVPPQCAFSHA